MENDPLIQQDQSTTIIWLSHKFLAVKIYLRDFVQTKKAAFRGSLLIQIHLDGKELLFLEKGEIFVQATTSLVQH